VSEGSQPSGGQIAAAKVQVRAPRDLAIGTRETKALAREPEPLADLRDRAKIVDLDQRIDVGA
jgi:hypothetical protein